MTAHSEAYENIGYTREESLTLSGEMIEGETLEEWGLRVHQIVVNKYFKDVSDRMGEKGIKS